LDRNLATDAPRHATGHAALNLTGHTACLIPARLVRHRPRDAVGNFTGAALLNHGAHLIRNSSRVAFFNHLAGGIRNASRAALFDDPAAGVRNSSRAALLDHRASRVRNLPAANLLFRVADGIRNALRHRARNLVAARVGNLAVMDLLHVPRAGDLLLFDARAPDLLAADGRRALHLFGPAAARPVAAAASAGIPFPGSGILHATTHHRPRNAFLDRFPFTGADIDALGLADGAAGRVAHVAVTRFGASAVRRAANVAVAGLIDRPANGVAAFPVARRVDRPRDRVALIAVMRFVNRTAHDAGLFAVTRLVNGAADFATDVAIARLILGPADGVAFVTVTGIVNSFAAGHRDRFANRIVDRLGAGVVFLFPDDLVDCLITSLAGCRGRAVICGGSSARWRAGRVARSSAIARVDRSASAHDQKQSGKRANSKAGFHGVSSSPRAARIHRLFRPGGRYWPY